MNVCRGEFIHASGPSRLFSRAGARCHNAPIVQSRPPKVATRAPQVAKLTQGSPCTALRRGFPRRGTGSGCRRDLKGGIQNATAWHPEGHKACPAVREDQAKRPRARCVAFSGERDRGAHRAEEPCSLWGVQDQIAQLHPRCLTVAPWWPAVRDEPIEGPNQGAALQPGEAPADRRPLRHEQEPTATSGRRKKPLKFCLTPRMRGKHRLSRGSGRAFGDPLLRRPPT